MFEVPRGRVSGRVLQLTAPAGLPPAAALSYTGRFPFVELEYRDPALACEATLEAFCPFIPRDAESSSVPIIFFTFRIRNPTAQPITVAAAMSWVNDIAAETWRKGSWQEQRVIAIPLGR